MGSGYRVFTAGEVLTASNVQNFLQNQSVMSFADSTARATSIGTANFEEGMLSYLQDSDTLEVYDGSVWGNIAPASTSGLTLISTTSFSAVASQSISDVFSATYDRYLIATEISSASANVDILMRLRVSGSDATGSDYSYAGSGWRATNAQFTPVSTGTTSFDVGRAGVAYVCHAQINVVNPFKTVKTVVLGQYGAKDSVSTFVNPFAGNHDLATSYTGFTLFPNTGTMTGSVRVYGYAN